MAEAIKGRMQQRGLTPSLFVELSGLTEPGLAPVRRGQRKRYAPRTIAGVATALRWPLDWYERLTVGDDWETFPDVTHPDRPLSDRERLTQVERQLADLRREVAALVERLRQQGP